MLNTDVQSILKRGDHLFNNRGSMLSFWQTAGENFYPERAHFTASPVIGEDFASHLYTSYPIIVRRELSGAFSSMLRRRDTEWMKMTVKRDDKIDSAGKAWLDYATKVQRRAMYDTKAKFVRATKEGDDDYTAFGQCCITREINWRDVSLLYRTHHLRDCAWQEDITGEVVELHINWTPTYDQLEKTFGRDKLHHEMAKMLTDAPFSTANIRLAIVPSSYYEHPQGEGMPAKSMRKAYTWLYIDVANQHVIEVRGRVTKGFTLARWQTVSGSPIAYSPAVIAALPDARLIQAMTLTLLEAGEMGARPPVLARQEVIRGDANLFAGGITWAQLEGDEKLSETMRPIYDPRGNAGALGLEMNQDTRMQIASAFYLNKLNLPTPEAAGQMTAYEVAQRLKEWIRAAIPLFEPIESEYNADLCEGTFADLFNVRAFGPITSIPESVLGNDVEFQFQSPLTENIERQAAHTFMEARSIILAAMDLDQAAPAAMDVRSSLVEALHAVGVNPKHVRDKKDLDEFAAELEDKQKVQQLAQAAESAGVAAQAVGEGQQAMQQAALGP